MIDRRHLIAGMAASLATPAFAIPAFAQSTSRTNMSRVTAYAFSFPRLDGKGEIRLADYSGKPILVVNTASQCGYTPQFTGLQQLYMRFRERGLMVVGVPSNDFAQEPGDDAEIAGTAHDHYGVTFPLTVKTVIKGANRHPFYGWVASERPLDLPGWNFHKYLIGTDGHIAKVFPAEIEPLDARVVDAVAKALPAAG